jgi:hypothetical protein
MSIGEDDSLHLGADGGLWLKDSDGRVNIGNRNITKRPSTHERGLFSFDTKMGGTGMLNSRELRLNDRNGMPVAVVPQ